MKWYIKWLPFLFKIGADGKFYLFYRSYHFYTSENGQRYVYWFKSKESFILEKHAKDYFNEETGRIEQRAKDLQWRVEHLSTQDCRKAEKLRDLETNNQMLNVEIKSAREDIVALEIEKVKLEAKIDALNISIKDIKTVAENDAAKLLSTIDIVTTEKNAEIANLKQIINKDRERLQILMQEMQSKEDVRYDKLVKQFDLLDKDFVDVATAMRIFRKGTERPSRGFRIRIQDDE